jgi:hypothetical protein
MVRVVIRRVTTAGDGGEEGEEQVQGGADEAKKYHGGNK